MYHRHASPACTTARLTRAPNDRPISDGMTHRLIRTPWALAARGAAALLFGLLTLAWPSMTVTTFIALFAALALCDGLAAVVVPFRFRRRERDASVVRDPLLLPGVTAAALGLAVALWRDVSMQTLLALVAAWAGVTGAGNLYVATRTRPRPPAWWLLAAAGAAGLALAAFVLVAVAAGEVRVGWEVGAYGLTAGVLLLA